MSQRRYHKKIWLHRIGRNKTWKHFIADSFVPNQTIKNRRLNANAVPKLNLPDKTVSEVIPQNTKTYPLREANMNIDVSVYEVPMNAVIMHHQVAPQDSLNTQIQIQQPVNPPEPPPPPPDEAKPKLEKKKKEAIDGQAREIIFRVIKFFESEKQNRGYAYPVENVVKRACAATGLSESTIKRIKRDGLKAEATQTKMSGPKKRRVRKTKVQLDYFQLCALRGIVNSYSMRKEVPTLGKILTAARHELNFKGGKESLRLILLNKLGIKFKKCEKKNKKPPEQPAPQQPAAPPMHNMMPPPQMQHMKQVPPTQMQHLKPVENLRPLENQCVYTNLMPHVPPVSY